VRELAARPELAERVDVRDGYVPASNLATLMAAHDVLALPYRSATASQNALLGFAHGLPVLATRTGTFDTDVRDGVDGLLADPGSLESLVQALQRLMEPGVLDQLRAGVRPPDVEGPWAAYLHGVVGQAPAADGGATAQTAAPPGGAALEIAKRVAERGLWARVAVQRRAEARMQRVQKLRVQGMVARQRFGTRDVPHGVAPTDVLRSRAAWEAAVREARRLRLPLHHDRPKNWDALGAVAAVLQLADDGSRRARVLDAGSARYSPVLPWLRLYGFGDAPESLLGLNLEFGAPVLRDGVTFRYGDITRTGLGDGALDAITCMSVIEHGVPIDGFLAESARVLRPGGILTLSTDFDCDPPDTAGRTAYGVPVRIFGPADIKDLVSMAQGFGLDVVGDLSEPDFFAHAERPVHWQRLGLDYTFVLLTFRRR
jgi:SAM-dependent methyltransferase